MIRLGFGDIGLRVPRLGHNSHRISVRVIWIRDQFKQTRVRFEGVGSVGGIVMADPCSSEIGAIKTYVAIQITELSDPNFSENNALPRHEMRRVTIHAG